MPYRLERYEPLPAGLDRVVREQLAAAAEHLGETEDSPRSVHEARKRSKEARAALRLLRGELGEAARVARAAIRDAARQIAATRDAEVVLLALDKLRHERRLLRAEREAAEEALRARRDAARSRLTPELRATVAEAFLAAAAALPPPGAGEGRATVEAELGRLFRRGRRAMQQALVLGRAEDFHAWRKEAKDLWYAVRLFEGAWPGPLGALVEELHEVGQQLGEEHDLTVLRAALAGGDDAPSLLTPRLARAITKAQHELRVAARARGERLWAEPGKVFAARVCTYWAAWHRS